MSAPRILGLFEGYGGLTMGVQSVLGGDLVAYAEIEPAMVSLLAQHHPGIPNLGDVSAVDWSEWVGRVDVMTGGFPCQDVSLAGLRRGLRDGTRSGLWSEFARGIDVVRPGLVVIENVRGLLSAAAGEQEEPAYDYDWDPQTDRFVERDPWSLGDGSGGPTLRALGAVLGDLAELGYDARWCGVRAADAGAPHLRYRVFVIARPADAGDHGLGGQPQAYDNHGQVASGHDAHGRAAADAAGRGRHGRAQEPVGLEVERAAAAGGGGAARAAADADDLGLEERGASRLGTALAAASSHGGAAADALGGGRERRGEPGDMVGPPRASEGDRGEREREGHAADDRGAAARSWGEYAPAVERWESALGRVAPAPTNPDGKGGTHRLAPQFVEWMMGLPAGHVTDPSLGLTRAQQLKALGNGVVPQQAALAVAALLTAEATDEVAA